MFVRAGSSWVSVSLVGFKTRVVGRVGGGEAHRPAFCIVVPTEGVL